MRTPRRRVPRVLGWTAAGVVAVAVAAAGAWAPGAATGATRSFEAAGRLVADTTPAPSTEQPDAGRGHRGRWFPAGRALHGEFTVKGSNGAYQVLVAQRGTVTSNGDGRLTVRSADGFSATYSITAATKVHRGRTAIGTAEIKPDDRVVVVASKGADGKLEARRVGLRDPNAPRAPGPGKPNGSTPSPSPSAQPGSFSRAGDA